MFKLLDVSRGDKLRCVKTDKSLGITEGETYWAWSDRYIEFVDVVNDNGELIRCRTISFVKDCATQTLEATA